LKGHDFSRAEVASKEAPGFSPCGKIIVPGISFLGEENTEKLEESGEVGEKHPSGVKAHTFIEPFAARLKSCPFKEACPLKEACPFKEVCPFKESCPFKEA
jgi:hypothetical protein